MKTILSFILAFIAILLVFLCGGLFFMFSVLYRSFCGNLGAYFWSLALSLDQLGNVIAQDVFNLLLIKKGGISFGNEDETISSVLGKNKLDNKLTRLGKGLDYILNKIDKNHTIKSIEKDE